MKYASRDNNRSGGYGRAGGKKFGGSSSYGASRGGFSARPQRGGDDRFEKPQLHNATCAGCGKECQVPFKPNGSKPIFCRFCFKKDGTGTTPKFERKPYARKERDDFSDFSAPRATAPAAGADFAKLEARMASIERKLDALIESVMVEEEDEDEVGEDAK